MTRSSKTTLWTTAFIVLLLVIDQASKIWVKTSMVEGEMHEITSWFKIYFVENEGMAYWRWVQGCTIWCVCCAYVASHSASA